MHGRFSIWGGTCSGVTRDVGALEQGVLTAPPEKIPEIFSETFLLYEKKIDNHPSKNSGDLFSVIAQYFVINHYNTRIFLSLLLS